MVPALAASPGATGEARQNQRRLDRRRHSVWSFLFGGFRPRRRRGRRYGDHNRVFLDWHEPRVLYLALGIVLMSCADALFTLNLLAAGGHELNVVMRSLLRRDVEHFLWVKIGLTGCSVVLLAVAAQRHVLGRVPVLRFMQAFCAGYAGLMIYELYLLGWEATRVGADTLDSLALWVAG